MIDSTTGLRKLLEALYLKTIAGNISWSYLQTIDLLETPLGQGYIQIAQETDEDGDYYTFIRILNEAKQVVENIYGGTLGTNNKPVNTAHKTYWELITDLRSVALRAAVGADAVLASMIQTLGAEDLDLDEVPF